MQYKPLGLIAPFIAPRLVDTSQECIWKSGFKCVLQCLVGLTGNPSAKLDLIAAIMSFFGQNRDFAHFYTKMTRYRNLNEYSKYFIIEMSMNSKPACV